jgi:anti-sigma B factor antagonist
MSLSLKTHRSGGIFIIACTGRLIEGGESSALQREIDGLLDESPYTILDVAGIEFIDSSGLGLLVRLLNRATHAGGDLKIAGASPHLREILRVTKLEKILKPYASVGEATAAIYDHARSTRRSESLAADILCVAASRDVLAYVSEILRQAGFGVLSADNLPDAVMLLRAARPRAIVITPELRSARAAAADTFNALAAPDAVVELPSQFSHEDAGQAGETLLERVRAVMGTPHI